MVVVKLHDTSALAGDEWSVSRSGKQSLNPLDKKGLGSAVSLEREGEKNSTKLLEEAMMPHFLQMVLLVCSGYCLEIRFSS